MNLRKTKLILFSMVVLTGLFIAAAEAKNKNTPVKTSVIAKKTKSVNSTQTEYPLFTCPGLKENGYCSNSPELRRKQCLHKLPKIHFSDSKDLEEFLDGKSASLNGFDSIPYLHLNPNSEFPPSAR
ncbi:MAG: hypothetical protein KIT34_07880 [Cyanobacteria bacterium TGS_CYA1]|nr:hypothetical protein [Cyanobacteria bacterium TGS_CYA1]